ncbi:MAG: hypothetical protein CMF23_17415 [Ignavibacteriae bacterium]|nr:hypothetical protein [Ignavibacteriota bacterium]
MSNASGTNKIVNFDFIELCKSYLKIAYPNLSVIDANSSVPINAYAFNSDSIFSIISLNSSHQISKFISKDISTLNSSKYASTSLIYFVDLKDEADKSTLDSLASSLSNNDYNVSIYSSSFLYQNIARYLNQFHSKSNKLLSDDYSLLNDTDEDVESVFLSMVKFVASKKDFNKVIPIPSNNLIQLRDKIRLNFSPHLQISVLNNFHKHWNIKMKLDNFISNNFHNYEAQLYSILLDIQNSFIFYEYNRDADVEYPVNNPQFFHIAADNLGPNEFKHDPRYRLTSMALVLYFFEYCDFGTKSNLDAPSLFTTYVSEDDNSK